MKKWILVAGLMALPVLAMLIAAQTTPATPAMNCTSEMKKTDAMMMTATDAKKKEMAMKEIGLAKDMMAKNDEKGCMMHTGEAMKALK